MFVGVIVLMVVELVMLMLWGCLFDWLGCKFVYMIGVVGVVIIVFLFFWFFDMKVLVFIWLVFLFGNVVCYGVMFGM